MAQLRGRSHCRLMMPPGEKNRPGLLGCLMAREESVMRTGKEASHVLWKAGMQQITTELHVSCQLACSSYGGGCCSSKDAHLQIRSREGSAHQGDSCAFRNIYITQGCFQTCFRHSPLRVHISVTPATAPFSSPCHFPPQSLQISIIMETKYLEC